MAPNKREYTIQVDELLKDEEISVSDLPTDLQERYGKLLNAVKLYRNGFATVSKESVTQRDISLCDKIQDWLEDGLEDDEEDDNDDDSGNGKQSASTGGANTPPVPPAPPAPAASAKEVQEAEMRNKIETALRQADKSIERSELASAMGVPPSSLANTVSVGGLTLRKRFLSTRYYVA